MRRLLSVTAVLFAIAAGVATATSVATEGSLLGEWLESLAPNDPSSLTEEVAAASHLSDDSHDMEAQSREPVTPPPHSKDQSWSPNFTVNVQSPPGYAPYQPAVTQKYERIVEDALDVAKQAVSRQAQLPVSQPQPQPQLPQPTGRGQLPPAPVDPRTFRPPGESLPPRVPNPNGTFARPANTQEALPNTEPPRIEVKRVGGGKVYANLRNSEIRAALQMLSDEGKLSILASPKVQGPVYANLNGVDIMTALEAILKSTGFSYRKEGEMIFVGTKEELEDMARIDEQVRMRIYRPNYISAVELQVLVGPMLTEAVGQASVGAAPGAAAANAISRISTTSPNEAGIAPSTTEAGADAYAGQDVLLVRDYESVLNEIDRVIEQVDKQPLQVAIEAMILAVDLDDSNEIGVNFELLRDQNNARLISGTPPSSLATIDVSSGGLKFGFLDRSLALFVEALETVGDTNVVASPRVLCLNKQRADILIGSELGYVSTTVTETASTQAVEFLEVGTQLHIRPFISSDGMIRMEVHPELSTGTVRVEQGFTLPDKDVTQVTTNVLCPDGCTMVIGGLIREDLGNNTTQIPWLGSIPYVGPLFRQKTETTDRQEVIVLLTPRILYDEQLCKEGCAASEAFMERQHIFRDKMNPFGKRHFGRRYLRLARAAWAAGDTQAAFRYCNLAIHFDPVNLEAIQLRNEITSATNYPRTIHSDLHEGLPYTQRPKRNYSNQGYPWKEEPPYRTLYPRRHETNGIVEEVIQSPQDAIAPLPQVKE